MLISKLRVKEIADAIGKKSEPEMSYDSSNFCEQNRFGSYTCTLCKVILPSLGAYEKHAQSEIHKINVDNYNQRRRVYTQKPIVILSIFEHNANLIPWRETGAEIILVPMTAEGDFDYHFLQL